KVFESLKRIFESLEDFDNDLEKSPLALRVVPLPEFTIDKIPREKVEHGFKRIMVNVMWFLFIPRTYKINRNQKDMLSPFSRVVRHEENDDMYDNPATEAVIDFRWQKSRNFLLSLFLRFLIFASCFMWISWEYLSHDVMDGRSPKVLIAAMVILYYLATYLFATEVIQLYYQGPRKYFSDIFNAFDIIAIVLPVVVVSLTLKDFNSTNGYGNVEFVNKELMVGISFSIFFLWIEFVSFFFAID